MLDQHQDNLWTAASHSPQEEERPVGLVDGSQSRASEATGVTKGTNNDSSVEHFSDEREERRALDTLDALEIARRDNVQRSNGVRGKNDLRRRQLG